jgi:hypothetical protein
MPRSIMYMLYDVANVAAAALLVLFHHGMEVSFILL